MEFRTGTQVIATGYLVPKMDNAANHYMNLHQSSPTVHVLYAIEFSVFTVRHFFM